jgi:Ca2+-dependent lipid-binding protein
MRIKKEEENDKTYLLTKFVISSVMAIMGIIAIWYLEDIRFKMFGMILLIWEGFYWYSQDYYNFQKLIGRKKEERNRKEKRK